MKPRRLATAVAASALFSAVAFAFPSSPVQNLLLAARDPADLRARLVAHADSVRDDALEAGEAWHCAGTSWARSGRGDSAIVAFGRALALRGEPVDALAIVDVLLARGSGADLDSAASLLVSLLAQPGGGFADEMLLRDAWVRARRGDSGALGAIFEGERSPLFRPGAFVDNLPLWAGRFAALALDAGEVEAAWRMISPLAVATRGGDPEVSRLARAAATGIAPRRSYDEWLKSACLRADTSELAAIRGVGARPLAVRAEDGAILHAWFVPGPPGAAIAVVTAPAGSEQAAECDSLVIQLRRAGLAVALLEPRGVRRSASASEPAALLRTGREETDLRRLARDLGSALTAAGRAAGTARPRGVVVGVGPAAISAVLAAGTDLRVRAVVLAGPQIAPVDRGWLRASLAASAVPAFFETGPENIRENLEVDRIVAELPPGQTRVADSRSRWSGAALFRAGPEQGARLAGWLSGPLKRPRATPPAPPR